MTMNDARGDTRLEKFWKDKRINGVLTVYVKIERRLRDPNTAIRSSC